ncbi:triose-phosphate isomerase [Patescibacteria group bacterium]|nr:triose-phosphate isomerase [Patescibacteria group bacterium]
MRTPLIAGNWKMNTTLADAHILATGIRNEAEHLEQIEIVLCPPSIWLTEVAHIVPPRHYSHLKLGAQNMYFEETGAFTGEISPLMVKEVAEYVIIGHSERTHLFGEKVPFLAQKVRSALDHSLNPIICVGEDAKAADSKRQLVHTLEHLTVDLTQVELEQIVIAYEPVWAIGSGTPATPDYAQEVIAALRRVVTEKTRMLYGGSVSDQNSLGFLSQPDIDGLLIGGASLKIKTFITIARQADDQIVAQKSTSKQP